jgi:hypothetical protein
VCINGLPNTHRGKHISGCQVAAPPPSVVDGAIIAKAVLLAYRYWRMHQLVTVLHARCLGVKVRIEYVSQLHNDAEA